MFYKNTKATSRALTAMLAIALTLSLAACGAKSAPASSSDTPATSAASATAVPAPEFTFRYAESQPADYPTTKAAEKFAELVFAKTNGRIKIEVYPGGQLGDEKSSIEQMQFGSIDFTRVSLGPLSEFSKSLNVLQLPYLYRDSAHMWTVVDGQIGTDFLNSLDAAGLVGLAWFDAGSRNFYNSQKEIKSLEDLKGLDIRVMESELMMDMVSALGANPTPMNSGEVYSALQTGTIDGAENNFPTYEANAHHEVAPYFSLDEHIRVPEPQVAAKKTMEKLTPEDQQIIRECAKESAKFQRELWIERDKASREKVVAAGVTITEISPEQKLRFQEACKPLYAKFAGEYTDLVTTIIETK